MGVKKKTKRNIFVEMRKAARACLMETVVNHALIERKAFEEFAKKHIRVQGA
jgi:hypothetical protein